MACRSPCLSSYGFEGWEEFSWNDDEGPFRDFQEKTSKIAKGSLKSSDFGLSNDIYIQPGKRKFDDHRGSKDCGMDLDQIFEDEGPLNTLPPDTQFVLNESQKISSQFRKRECVEREMEKGLTLPLPDSTSSVDPLPLPDSASSVDPLPLPDSASSVAFFHYQLVPVFFLLPDSAGSFAITR